MRRQTVFEQADAVSAERSKLERKPIPNVTQVTDELGRGSAGSVGRGRRKPLRRWTHGSE